MNKPLSEQIADLEAEAQRLDEYLETFLLASRLPASIQQQMNEAYRKRLRIARDLGHLEAQAGAEPD